MARQSNKDIIFTNLIGDNWDIVMIYFNLENVKPGFCLHPWLMMGVRSNGPTSNVLSELVSDANVALAQTVDGQAKSESPGGN